MIIFLFGKDTYRMKEKLKEIIDSYKEANKSCLSLKFFDCQKENILKTLKDDLCQTSMFKEKKLIILRDPLSDVDFKEKFLKEKKFFLESENIIVFYQETDFNKNNSLFNFLKKNVKSQEFELLSGIKLKNWVKKQFDKYKAKINFKALDLLLSHVGSDLWRMNNEILKLVNYRKGEEIGEKDIILQVRSSIETDIFKTIDAIAAKRKGIALNLLQGHIAKGDSPLYLFSMINYQFRNLLVVKDFIERCQPYNVIARKSGLHPFVVKKTYSSCHQFSFRELKKIYQDIFQIDLNMKTGKINPEIALDLLVATI